MATRFRSGCTSSRRQPAIRRSARGSRLRFGGGEGVREVGEERRGVDAYGGEHPCRAGIERDEGECEMFWPVFVISAREREPE